MLCLCCVCYLLWRYWRFSSCCVSVVLVHAVIDRWPAAYTSLPGVRRTCARGTAYGLCTYGLPVDLNVFVWCPAFTLMNSFKSPSESVCVCMGTYFFYWIRDYNKYIFFTKFVVLVNLLCCSHQTKRTCSYLINRVPALQLGGIVELHCLHHIWRSRQGLVWSFTYRLAKLHNLL